MAQDSPHGTRRRYQSGCRCDDCAEANSQASREYRARRRGVDPASVAVLPVGRRTRQRQSAAPQLKAGRLETVVAAELDGLPGVAARPGLAAAAVVLARDLDNPGLATSYAALTRQLRQTLEALHQGVTGRGRLKLVQGMSRRGG